jgi:hypothetical protein
MRVSSFSHSFLFDWKAAIYFVKAENGSHESCFLVGFFTRVYGVVAVCTCVLDKSCILDSSRGMLEMFFPWFEVMLLLGFCIPL